MTRKNPTQMPLPWQRHRTLPNGFRRNVAAGGAGEGGGGCTENPPGPRHHHCDPSKSPAGFGPSHAGRSPVPAALPFGGCQGVPCLGGGHRVGCHPVPPELGVLRHVIGRTVAPEAGIPGRRQQSGTGRGRCAQQAELLARCSGMWDGCPAGHADGFWGHRPQPTLLPPPLLAPALATAWGHPCSLGAPWGLRSGVPSTTRWHRLAAMVAAMGEGGERAWTQLWTHGCHGARVSVTSMPCARATIAGGSQHRR